MILSAERITRLAARELEEDSGKMGTNSTTSSARQFQFR
jgi:hypothetical protein